MKKSKTLCKPLGGDEIPDWYVGTTLEEIRVPTASEEVLEASKGEGMWVPQSEAIRESPWRPDRVRLDRKLKQRMDYLRKKMQRPAKRGRPKVYKTYWQRRKRKSEYNWKDYHQRVCRTGWDKYLKIWTQRRYPVEITKEEFEKLLESLGGLLEVTSIRCWEKVARKENLLIVGDDGRVLYRGTNVPEWLGPCGAPRLAAD